MAVFEASVIAIGIIGGIANLLMLLILVQSKARKYDMTIVFSQMSLDFICCLQLVVSYVFKILDIDYNVTITGSVVCKVLTGESLVWFFLGCSTANLVVLTLERYVKVVHAMFHKRYFRRSMYPVVITFTVINPDTVLNGFADLSATMVVNGQCAIYFEYPAGIDPDAYAVYKFLTDFVLPLVVFVFCYSRILQLTRRHIVPVNFNNMKSVAEQQAMKTQMNVIKTFLIISVCYVVCWAPNRLYFFFYNLRIAKNLSSNGRYITVFMAFLYLCLNPFIYAAKLDPVKKYLREKFCSRQRQENDETVVSVINTNSRAVTRH